MRWWIRANSERISLREMNTTEILEAIKTMESVLQNGRNSGIDFAAKVAIRKLNKQLKARNLL